MVDSEPKCQGQSPMTDFFSAYGLFLLQTLTVLAAVVVVIAISARASQGSDEPRGQIRLTDLSTRLKKQAELITESLESMQPEKKRGLMSRTKARVMQWIKGGKGADEAANDAEVLAESATKPVAVVLEFKGDMKASQVSALRQEITAILAMSPAPERVLLKLTSPGGLVHTYGLASSQLSRLSEAQIALTVSVDTVAASGGYMMAVCAREIIAAPFAVLGSIGVVAQVPNLHRFLKSRDVDIELHTAGAHKRTLTVLGENTPEGRRKFKEDLQHTHDLFKAWIAARRPKLDLDEVADGSIFYGSDALEKGLCDRVATSDDVLLEWAETHQLVGMHWHEKKSLAARLGRDSADAVFDRIENLFLRTDRDFTQL